MDTFADQVTNVRFLRVLLSSFQKDPSDPALEAIADVFISNNKAELLFDFCVVSELREYGTLIRF